MKLWPCRLQCGTELRKACKQNKNAAVHMTEEGHPPGINMNVFLFYFQKANISVIRNVVNDDPEHQVSEEH